MCHSLKVLRVNAVANAAKVVDSHTLGCWALVGFKANAMGENLHALKCEPSVSVAVGVSSP